MSRDSPRICKTSHCCCHLLFICRGIRAAPLTLHSPDPAPLNFSSFHPGPATLTQRKAFKSVKRCLVILLSPYTLLLASNLGDTFCYISWPDFISISLLPKISDFPFAQSPWDHTTFFRTEFKVSTMGPFYHVFPCVVQTVLAADGTLPQLKTYLHFLAI